MLDFDKIAKISVTPDALNRIYNIKTEEKPILRITIDGGGCNGFIYDIKMDCPRKEDYFVLHESEIILATDESSVSFLQDCTVDFVTSIGTGRFKIINPKASSSCSCGNSFDI